MCGRVKLGTHVTHYLRRIVEFCKLRARWRLFVNNICELSIHTDDMGYKALEQRARAREMYGSQRTELAAFYFFVFHSINQTQAESRDTFLSHSKRCYCTDRCGTHALLLDSKNNAKQHWHASSYGRRRVNKSL